MKNRLLCLALVLASALPLLAYQRDAESAGRWHEDLAYFRRELPKRHINAFHDLSREDFERMVADLDGHVDTLQDHELIVGLARIVAHLGPRDGHSRLNLFNPALKFHALPLNLYSYTDGLFVRAAGPAYADLAGAKVLAIGGTPVAEALARVGDVTAADNDMTKKAWTPELLILTEVLRALHVAAGAPDAPVDFELELPGGRRVRRTVQPVDSLDGVLWTDMRAQAKTQPLYRRWAATDPFNHHGAQKNFWYEYLGDRKVLYVNFSGVSDAPDETVAAFFERVFAFAAANPVDKFVLDIRNNGGGNNYLNRPVFYGLVSRASTIARRGTFFCIIGRATFSAAQNLANLVDEHTAAILVGEPTGGAPNHYGDAMGMVLPNSKVRVQLTSVWWQDLDPRDFRPWIAPQIAAELSSADDRLGRDPALEAVLDYQPEISLSEKVRNAIISGGKAEVTRVVAAWRNDPRHKFLTGEAELNRLAANLYGEKRPDDAVMLFELNAQINPDSWLAQNSAGRAFAAAGRKEEALAAFQRALRIRPNAPQTLNAMDQVQ